MAFTPGLRSCYSVVGRLVYFGRMLDKIRLHASGRLPADYQGNLGIGFDGRTCGFLGISYEAIKTRALAGGCDEEILKWAHAEGGARSDEQCNLWNRFMMKIGWRDDRTAVLTDRIAAFGLLGSPIETFFDLNEFDEGRDPVAGRFWELNEARILMVMGVAGSGKSTIGSLLAATLGWKFTDADDFHPAANVSKIAGGAALTDKDRAPWLAALRAHIDSRLAAHDNTVLACSALKETYRRVLVSDPGRVKLIYLNGSPELLLARLEHRVNHFAGPGLLNSQLATLEEPENALVVDVSDSPEVIVANVRRHYAL